MSEPRLSIIPGWIITDPRLKGKDLQVLCMLGRNANTRHGWCRRSQVKLAAELGCARSTVQSAIERLVEIGAVVRHEVASASGRDSAHWYRVIYDSTVTSNAFNAWDDEDEKEFGPIDAVGEACPPAGISAPPAGPESAPPAGSGPAPINASTLTPPIQREERERPRGNEDEEENPKALERRMRAWWKIWPSFETDTEGKVRSAWLVLTPEQRKACEQHTPAYLERVKSQGRQFSKAGSTYLSERAWERLQEKPAAGRTSLGETATTFTAYSRPWSALRLAELCKHPVHLVLDKFEERIIAANPEKEAMIWQDKRMQKGWPEANRLHQAAIDRKQVTVPASIVAISQAFDKVEIGGLIWEAWKRLHQDRCWPWLPTPHGIPVVQFPALPEGVNDPDEAVAEALRLFQRSLIEERERNDAA